MNVISKTEVCDIFARYVRVTFDTARKAADHYQVNEAFISNVKTYRSAPTKPMLDDIGYTRERGFKKVKK